MQVRNMRTRAIILKKQNTNEYDQLVTCYTEELGKMTAIAKSVLKPKSIQGMHLDIFNLVDFDLINGRGIPIITGAQAENVYPNLKSDLSRLAVAYFFAETADKLFFEYQKDQEVWNFFSNLLKELDSTSFTRSPDSGEYLRTKQIEFLNILGYAPNFDNCSVCNNRINGRLVAYSVEAKGALCQNCFLDGRSGLVLKNGEIFTGPVLGAIFEGLTERKINSLDLVKSVVI